MLTLAICMVKLYIISVIQGSMTIYNSSFGRLAIFLKMTFMLGLIIVGNVVDNVSQPKWVAIFLQLALGVSWFLTGCIVYQALHDEKHDSEEAREKYAESVLF